MLTFTILWAYMSFSQFLIQWAGQHPGRDQYYRSAWHHGWQYLGLGLLVLHFFLPFFCLLSRDLKRNARGIGTLAVFILVMRQSGPVLVRLPQRPPRPDDRRVAGRRPTCRRPGGRRAVDRVLRLAARPPRRAGRFPVPAARARRPRARRPCRTRPTPALPSRRMRSSPTKRIGGTPPWITWIKPTRTGSATRTRATRTTPTPRPRTSRRRTSPGRRDVAGATSTATSASRRSSCRSSRLAVSAAVIILIVNWFNDAIVRLRPGRAEGGVRNDARPHHLPPDPRLQPSIGHPAWTARTWTRLRDEQIGKFNEETDRREGGLTDVGWVWDTRSREVVVGDPLRDHVSEWLRSAGDHPADDQPDSGRRRPRRALALDRPGRADDLPDDRARHDSAGGSRAAGQARGPAGQARG